MYVQYYARYVVTISTTTTASSMYREGLLEESEVIIQYY